MVNDDQAVLDRMRHALAGRYVVEREIGRGASSVVLLARDVDSGAKVAIKVLRAELAESIGGERFLREVRHTSQLKHPNIVAVLDSGNADGALYATLAFLEGGTLRARLERQKQLPVDDVIAIGCAMCDALAFSHERNLIHRDVKPENILFDGEGRVYLVDFGIARALAHLPGESTTSTGLVRGTPAYMSPEQASGDRDLDGRSDIFSLACVLYEAIGGVPAFVGATSQAVLSQRLTHPARPVHVYRPSVPLALEQALEKALAIAPADRFQSAVAFGEALAAAKGTPPRSAAPARSTRGWRVARTAGSGALALAVVFLGARQFQRVSDARAVARADTSRIAVFPAERDSASAWSDAAERAFRDALVRWRGIEVLDRAAVLEAAGVKDGAALAPSAARRAALRLKAGRYVRLSMSSDGAGKRVRGALFDVAHPETPLDEGSVLIIAASDTAGSALARLADRLLLRPGDSAVMSEAPAGTSSVSARQAFLRGRAEIERWNLVAADSQYARALSFDARYSRASLWLSLVRFWAGRDRSFWASPGENAVVGRAGIVGADQPKVDAMASTLRGDRRAACAAWDGHAGESRADFAAWYGAAFCLAKDRTVLPDRASPSGWRFQGGYASAIERYRRAVLLNPAMLNGLRDDAFAAVRQWLWTSGTEVRFGVLDSKPPRYFAAYPSIEHDTLAFIPFPLDLIQAGDRATMGKISVLNAVVQRQKAQFREMAQSWALANPKSATAEQALAVALFQLGDPSARSHIERAETLVTDASENQRLLATELWIRLQLALPADVAELRVVQRRADSLTRAAEPAAVEPKTLASLGALLGHAMYAERMDRRVERRDPLVPTATVADLWGRALLIFSAFGGPVDSLRAMERRIDSLLTLTAGPASLSAIRAGQLGRAAQVAFPAHAFATIASMDSGGTPLLRAEASYLRGDTSAVRGVLAELRATREKIAAPELTIDAVYPEAWLLGAVGDTRGAIAWLDPSLTKIPLATSLVDPVRAAMLVRAMAFRAELAARIGDAETAARWANAVVTLWSGADAFLQPVVARMRLLVKK